MQLGIHSFAETNSFPASFTRYNSFISSKHSPKKYPNLPILNNQFYNNECLHDHHNRFLSKYLLNNIHCSNMAKSMYQQNNEHQKSLETKKFNFKNIYQRNYSYSSAGQYLLKDKNIKNQVKEISSKLLKVKKEELDKTPILRKIVGKLKDQQKTTTRDRIKGKKCSKLIQFLDIKQEIKCKSVKIKEPYNMKIEINKKDQKSVEIKNVEEKKERTQMKGDNIIIRNYEIEELQKNKKSSKNSNGSKQLRNIYSPWKIKQQKVWQDYRM